MEARMSGNWLLACNCFAYLVRSASGDTIFLMAAPDTSFAAVAMEVSQTLASRGGLSKSRKVSEPAPPCEQAERPSAGVSAKTVAVIMRRRNVKAVSSMLEGVGRSRSPCSIAVFYPFIGLD